MIVWFCEGPTTVKLLHSAMNAAHSCEYASSNQLLLYMTFNRYGSVNLQVQTAKLWWCSGSYAVSFPKHLLYNRSLATNLSGDLLYKSKTDHFWQPHCLYTAM